MCVFVLLLDNVLPVLCRFTHGVCWCFSTSDIFFSLCPSVQNPLCLSGIFFKVTDFNMNYTNSLYDKKERQIDAVCFVLVRPRSQTIFNILLVRSRSWTTFNFVLVWTWSHTREQYMTFFFYLLHHNFTQIRCCNTYESLYTLHISRKIALINF